MRPKRDFLQGLERDLKSAKLHMPVSMSNSSDPYPAMEKKMNITRGTLNLLQRYGFPVLVLTKSELIARDRDILEKIPAVVSITITTLNESLAKKLEPFASLPEMRLRALERLREKDINIAVRIDPLIPGINDSIDELEALIRELAGIGVKQIISSTYKAKADNFLRVAGIFKNQAEKLHKIYYEKNETIRGIRYAPRELRVKILSNVRKIADKYGIPFSVCREGLNLNSALTCDGSHLLH